MAFVHCYNDCVQARKVMCRQISGGNMCYSAGWNNLHASHEVPLNICYPWMTSCVCLCVGKGGEWGSGGVERG